MDKSFRDLQLVLAELELSEAKKNDTLQALKNRIEQLKNEVRDLKQEKKKLEQLIEERNQAANNKEN
ncbi:unnamed protein product [Auanema sp. JU1783]|nr:unnamed protein product [Auanema sp. JU1783]